MEIYIRGLASGYEPEHVARLFFQPALLAKRWPARGADAVAVLRGKKRFVCGVRMNGLCVVRTAPLARDTLTLTWNRDMPPAVSAVRGHCMLTPGLGQALIGAHERLVHDMRPVRCRRFKETESFFRSNTLQITKYKLAVRTADNQAPVLALNTPGSYSLYTSPFRSVCPRCSY